MNKNEIQELARQIATETVRLTGSNLVTTSGISLMCGLSPNSSSMRKMLSDPSFPKPISLCDGARKRWLRKDVEGWLEDSRGL